MLPVINLDDETYESIFEKARNMIAGIYPEWTDYNEHDPGITFLQLFSWMKEMQQFHLNQIGEEHLRMYLKLLGMEQRKKKAAHTLVDFSQVQESFLLPRGTRLLADNIPFETQKEEMIERISLTECLCITKEGQIRIDSETLRQDNKMRCFLLGEEPAAGNEFLMEFDSPLKEKQNHTIYFEIYDEYPIARNSIDTCFSPLVKIVLEYYGEEGFIACSEVEDDTDQLLHSGIMQFQVSDKMKPMENGNYGLRLRLVSGEYDIAPVLQDLVMNVIPVRQEATLADYEDVCLQADEQGVCSFYSSRQLFIEGRLDVYQKLGEAYVQVDGADIRMERSKERLSLYISLKQMPPSEEILFRIVGYDANFLGQHEYTMDGFPYQSIDLGDTELLHDSFELMVRQEETARWECWEKVDNFHCSRPEDRHYRLDEEKGRAVFGDMEQGLAPEGTLRIIRYVQSLGRRGNVRCGQIQTLEASEIPAVVSNRQDVSNGEDKESLTACFSRFRKESCKIERAVTTDDYEALVLRTPGLRIQRVKAVPMEFSRHGNVSAQANCVSIVVQPYSLKKQEKLSGAYIHNIMAWLNAKRMIGTKVRLLSPDYIGVTLFADVVVKPHYPTAQKMVEEAVRRYFEEAVADFGAILEESELYGLLDGLACVTEVRNLAMQAQGRGVRRAMNGTIRVPVNGLLYLKQADYIITTSEA